MCRAAACPDEGKLTSAYCYLTYPTRKLLFDLHGSIPEPLCFDNFRALGCPSHDPTPEITSEIVLTFSDDGFEWLLFIFDSFECPGCAEYLEIWEEASLTLQDLVKVGRINATTDPFFVNSLNLTLPAIVRVYKSDNSIHFTSLAGPFTSHSDIFASFIAQHTPLPKILSFSGTEKAKGIALRFMTDSGGEAEVRLQFIAWSLGSKFQYWTSAVSSEPGERRKSDWAIRMVFIERDSTLISIIPLSPELPMPGLLRVLPEFSLAKLNRRNFEKVCGDLCMARVGEQPDEEFAARYGNWIFPVHSLALRSEFAKRAKASHDDRIILNGERAWRVPAYMGDSDVRRALSALTVGSNAADELFAEMNGLDISDLIVFPHRDKYWMIGAGSLLALLIGMRICQTIKPGVWN
jgi:hypothetical protein